jgi:hypothetical protein
MHAQHEMHGMYNINKNVASIFRIKFIGLRSIYNNTRYIVTEL